jgi:hypothetical protein
MHALERTEGNTLALVDATRVARAVWILAPRAVRAGATVEALESAYRETLALGARDVVVDLGRHCPIDRAGASAIVALAKGMLERDSTLWLASTWQDGRGHTLRPLREVGFEHLRGVSSELDEALDALESEHPVP